MITQAVDGQNVQFFAEDKHLSWGYLEDISGQVIKSRSVWRRFMSLAGMVGAAEDAHPDTVVEKGLTHHCEEIRDAMITIMVRALRHSKPGEPFDTSYAHSPIVEVLARGINDGEQTAWFQGSAAILLEIAQDRLSTSVLPALVRAVQEHPLTFVRRMAFSTIRQMARRQPVESELIDSLTESLKSPDAPIRFAAAYQLGEIGSSARASLAALLHATKDQEPRVRLAARIACHKIETGLTAKGQMLEVSDQELREHSLYVAFFQAQPFFPSADHTNIGTIDKQLAEADPFDRLRAIASLVDLKDDSSTKVRLLAKAASDRCLVVRGCSSLLLRNSFLPAHHDENLRGLSSAISCCLFLRRSQC